jgi:hypothetical protein
MDPATIAHIEEQLRQLPPEKLALVRDIVSYLAERERSAELLETMLASESSLRKDWDRPEEDAAWAHVLADSNLRE